MPNSPNSDDPVTVAIARVYACLCDDRWFLARLDTGELAVVELHIVDERATWTLVDESLFGGGLEVNEYGVPTKFETIECPICASHVDVTFACPKKLADVYTLCPKCGYRIDDIEQYIINENEEDASGGTGER